MPYSTSSALATAHQQSLSVARPTTEDAGCGSPQANSCTWPVSTTPVFPAGCIGKLVLTQYLDRIATSRQWEVTRPSPSFLSSSFFTPTTILFYSHQFQGKTTGRILSLGALSQPCIGLFASASDARKDSPLAAPVRRYGRASQTGRCRLGSITFCWHGSYWHIAAPRFTLPMILTIL